MALYQGVETQQVAATISLNYGTFEGGIQRLQVQSDVDCYIDFDTPAVTSRSFLVKSGAAYSYFDFGFANVQKVFVITGGGTGKLYLIGFRGNSS